MGLIGKELFYSMNQGVLVLDQDNRISDANPAACTALSLAREEIMHARVWDILIPPGTSGSLVPSGWQAILLNALNHHLPISNLRFVRKNQDLETPCFFSLDIIPAGYGNDADTPALVLISCQSDAPISPSPSNSHIEMDDSVRVTHKILQSVLDTLPVGVWIVDKEGVIQTGNPAGIQIWQGARFVGTDEYGAFKAWRIDSGEEIKPDEWAAAKAVRDGTVTIDEELEIECFDGSHKFILNSALPLTDEKGKTSGAIIVNQDISERKQTELALTRWVDIFTHAEWGIVIIEGEADSFQQMNPAFARMHGYLVEELIGKPFLTVVAPEERSRLLDEISHSLEKPHYTFECIGYRKDGSRFPVIVDVTTVKSHDTILLHRIVNVQDITGLKAAEQALRRSEASLREAQHLTSIGSWEWDVRTDTSTWSKEMYRIMDMDDLLPPLSYEASRTRYTQESWDHLEKVVRTVLETGERYEIELDLISPSGTRKTVLARGHADRDEAGSVTRLFGTLQDISEKKAAEVLILNKESQFKAIFENTSTGIVFADQNGNIVLANQAASLLLEFNPAEIIGLNFATLSADPLSQEEWHHLLILIQDRGDQYRTEKEYLTRSGRHIWTDLTISLIRDQTGNPLYFIGVISDITFRKEVETALIESEEMFRYPVEHSPVGIFLVQDGVFLYVNPRLGEMLGESGDAMKGTPLSRFLHPDDVAVTESLSRPGYQVSPGVQHHEFRALRSDGTIITLESYSSFLTYHGRPALFGTLIDISERKQMQEQIIRSLREKEVLLREVHHRVKNNMQVVSSLLSMQAKLFEDPDIRSVFMESQIRIRSIALVHEQLYRSDDLSSIEIGEHIRQIVSQLENAYRTDGRQIQVRIDCREVMLAVDIAVPFSLIIHELISNSYKHAFPGRSSGTIWINLTILASGTAHLEYRDDGTGFRTDMNVEQMTSLGMRLIFGLVDQINGTLEFAEGPGAFVIIEFPLTGGS